MSDRWRVFVGRWDEDGDPEWTHLDETFTSYEAASARLAARLARFEDDTCEDCREAAAFELRRLLGQPDGGEIAAEVDGEHYLLVDPARTDLEDLYAAAARDWGAHRAATRQ